MRLIFCESYFLTYEGFLFLDGIDGTLEVESPPVFLYDGITPGELMGAELLDQQACSGVIADEAFTLDDGLHIEVGLTKGVFLSRDTLTGIDNGLSLTYEHIGFTGIAGETG